MIIIWFGCTVNQNKAQRVRHCHTKAAAKHRHDSHDGSRDSLQSSVPTGAIGTSASEHNDSVVELHAHKDVEDGVVGRLPTIDDCDPDIDTFVATALLSVKTARIPAIFDLSIDQDISSTLPPSDKTASSRVSSKHTSSKPITAAAESFQIFLSRKAKSSAKIAVSNDNDLALVDV
jgi:hypothetical protein